MVRHPDFNLIPSLLFTEVIFQNMSSVYYYLATASSSAHCPVPTTLQFASLFQNPVFSHSIVGALGGCACVAAQGIFESWSPVLTNVLLEFISMFIAIHCKYMTALKCQVTPIECFK